jgi:hypothetical protein
MICPDSILSGPIPLGTHADIITKHHLDIAIVDACSHGELVI